MSSSFSHKSHKSHVLQIVSPIFASFAILYAYTAPLIMMQFLVALIGFSPIPSKSGLAFTTSRGSSIKCPSLWSVDGGGIVGGSTVDDPGLYGGTKTLKAAFITSHVIHVAPMMLQINRAIALMYALTLIVDSIIRFSLFDDYTNICGAG